MAHTFNLTTTTTTTSIAPLSEEQLLILKKEVVVEIYHGVVYLVKKVSNFEEIVSSDTINFVGENPTFTSEEARFFCKSSYTYEDDFFIEEETFWQEIEEGEGDYYTMVLDHSEWSFFPAWKELKEEEEEEKGLKYCTQYYEDLENKLLAV